MKHLVPSLLLVLVLSCPLRGGEVPRPLEGWRQANPIWRGIQLSVGDDQSAQALTAELPKLAALGVNALVIEVDYQFAFQSHPELRADRVLSREGAAKLAAACRERGIRPIPLFNCLGHLCTTWGAVKIPQLAEWPPIVSAMKQWAR